MVSSFLPDGCPPILSSARLAKNKIFLTCIESRYKKEIQSQYIAAMQLVVGCRLKVVLNKSKTNQLRTLT